MINLTTARKIDKILGEEWKCKGGKVEPNRDRSIEELLEKLPCAIECDYNLTIRKEWIYTGKRHLVNWEVSFYEQLNRSFKFRTDHKNLAEALSRLLIKLKEETK